MGIEIRLFPGIDAFLEISGMPLAYPMCRPLHLAEQLLDSAATVSGRGGLSNSTLPRPALALLRKGALSPPKSRGFSPPPTLQDRAKARGLASATYLSYLTRSHLRGAAPLPSAEYMVLKQSVEQLAAVGRNLRP